MTPRRKILKPTGRPPITFEKQRWIFGVLLRSKDCAQQASGMLNADVFNGMDRWLYVVWQVAEQHLNQYGEMPSRRLLTTMINEHAAHNPQALGPGDGQRVADFLKFTFAMNSGELHEDTTLAWLKQFLEDRLIDNARTDLSSGQTPLDAVSKFMSLAQLAGGISRLSAAALPDTFPEGWETAIQAAQTMSTGLAFLDYFMGPAQETVQIPSDKQIARSLGGQRPKETYGLLGPYGGGKTTCAVQLTVRQAEMAYKERETAGETGPIRVAYHFSYEAPFEELQIRSLAYLSQIPVSRLTALINAGGDWRRGLCGPGETMEYERSLFHGAVASGASHECELERCARAMTVLDRHWRPIDMTGADLKNANRGGGLTQEIAQIIEQDLRSRQKRLNVEHVCSVVLADYVLAAIEKHLAKNELDRTELRHYVNRWPLHFKFDVANRFDCPVWSVQQLNTRANSFKPNRAASVTDSSEGKAFAENLDFMFMLAKADANGYVRFQCEKHRRAPKKPDRVLRLEGELARLTDCTDFVAIDMRTGAGISRSEQASLGPVEHAPDPTRPAASVPNPATTRGGVGAFTTGMQ